MVDKIKGVGDFIMNLVQTKQGTFTLGFLLSGIVCVIMYLQMDDYKTYSTIYKNELLECQKNSTTIEVEAQKNCIQNAQKQIEAIMQVSEVLKGQNENQKTYIEQRKKRMEENKKFINEIEKLKNENS